jgi:hypothetical protein
VRFHGLETDTGIGLAGPPSESFLNIEEHIQIGEEKFNREETYCRRHHHHPL